MAVPKQVQAQLDEANRILEQVNNPVPPGEPSPDLAKLATEPAANAPQATPEPPEPAAPAPTAPKQDEETWEARYKALKGMYNKQVPELQGQVSTLTQQVDELKKLVTAPPATAPAQQPAAPTADPQDIEAFGEDLVNMVKRTAERMFGGAARQMNDAVSRVEERLGKLESELKGAAQTATMTAEQAFFDRLTRLVPNWEEINEDERFKMWCLEIDPTFGVPRQRGLQAAQNAMDADRVANFLRAYTGTANTTPPPKPAAPPVESQVSPRAVASAPPPAPASKPVLTAKQVEQFYRDVSQGVYRGREAEQQRIEQVINEALAEGRIR